ncbi:site-2 protease family protein [Streptomyces acidiscabies]|uniref:Site-2 protease family protein n=1 Tax=Streptomyces acidiscabies TaxID=42234 RepID=A0AAP6B7R1_9ACTN|nr:site-2 protease family protein [Streptomyces acidiscabies]MBZ3911921.1 site-2 protease family protein [Streptomyces acidiscabies]MDX2959728.1 site-2 protease family protein [Streptomyces acidiscabies]MDX3022240.1 site-2 protease family protein [Streptomyces acidiscabies]MDX3792594.1 site-2 protease family protein [Streptomyces acidiscabies]GAQ56833.1 putative zinc metalloprotease Rip3 [Streptomyces acidiscabies]
MVESGGSGQPRPDNEQPTEHPSDPAPKASKPPHTPEPPTNDSPDETTRQIRRPEQQAEPEHPEEPPTGSDTPASGPQPSDETTRHLSRPAEPEAPSTPADSGDATRHLSRPAEPEQAAPSSQPSDEPQSDDATRQIRLPAEPSAEPTDDTTRQPSRPADPERPSDTAAPQLDDATRQIRLPAAEPSAKSPASTPSPYTTPDTHPDRTHAHGHAGAGKKEAEKAREPRSGILMGRPFGVPVYVAPSWFLVAALITWVFGGQLDRVLPELGATRYLVALFFAVAFYASVLVHELAHTVAALRFELPVRRIQLQFFGGVSEIEKEAETPGREFWLAFVGPLLSLVLSGLFYLAMLLVEPGTVPGVLLAGLMISNLIVAIFNLLPGLPLDGGRMLRAVVWKITGKPMNGTIAAAWVGRALAVSVLIGLPLLTQSGALGTTAEDSVGMDTVTDALLAAILAAIIWTGAGNSLRMARLREHLPELRARNLTRRAVPVETDTPLSEALRRANAAGARALVVVDANGEPLSLVREAAIVGVPEHRRPWVAVSGLAQDLTDGMRVSAELAGEDLLDVLRATPATEYLVVEDTGEIYGVLSAADVERAFVKAMARPS